MKLRLLDDSIRLRLSRSEVVAGGEGSIVEGRTRFPDGSKFTFALEALEKGAPPAGEDQSDMFRNPAKTC